ncbi:MAG: hypothetical protein IJX63_11220, partial [Lachnospiraceae bacterium]|nr:hypothetical protein [Lachnospiraceae bacterium]
NGKGKDNVFVYIAPEDKAVQSTVPYYEDTYNVGEDLELWIESITDYVLRNIGICRKYICAETAKEYRLIYDDSNKGKLEIQAILENGQRVSMLAEAISGEDVSEDDRDDYKEVMCARDVVWPEFCQFVEKENVKSVMKGVSLRVMKELEV